MKVLILGGTGAMGVHLVKLLLNEGHDVFVTSRSARESKGNLRYIQGDAHDIEFLKEYLNQKWDVIVDFMVYTTPDFKNRINLLLDAANQYIFLSSARVYANSVTPITERSSRLLDVSTDSTYLETDEYALTKARQEDVLIGSSRNNWTVIRPYITYSESRLQLGVLEKEAWLYRAIKGRTIVFSKDINDKITTLTYGLDVSQCIKGIIGKDGALGEIFHVTQPRSIRWSEALSIYLDVLEEKLGFRPKVLLIGLEDFNKIHSSNYQIIYDRLYNRAFDNNKIQNVIDPVTFLPVVQGLKDCLSHFLRDGKFDAINWKLEAIKDRQCKERTPLNEIAGYKRKLSYLIYRFIKN